MPDSIPETIPTETLTRADGSHEAFTGTHEHSHPALSSQGDDENHSHSHEHSDDADHGHGHEERAAVADITPETLFLYAPLVRVDADEWMIEGQATSEAIDTYGTIFEYESSKKAFQRWMKRGNIREQHDPRKAVGKALAVEFDDANKAIFVRARISKGAKDTWEKILDGTLSGFSIGVPSITAKKKFIERSGKQVPMYYDHDLGELSVVDAPGSPGCDMRPLLRADGIFTDIVDDVTDETPVLTLEQQQEEVQRAGATISAATKNKLHDSIGHTLMAARSQMQNCAESGCPDCAAAVQTLDPDNDGDIDAFGGAFGDTDGDAGSLSDGGDSDMARAVTELVERVVTAQLTPVYARLQGIAGTLARSNPNTNIEALITGAITRAVDAATSANATSLDEVRTELSVVKGQVATIANQPMPGPPIQHAGAVPRSPGKHLPTDPFQSQRRSGSAVFDALSEMSDRGDLNTVKLQEDAAYAHLLAQRGGL